MEIFKVEIFKVRVLEVINLKVDRNNSVIF